MLSNQDNRMFEDLDAVDDLANVSTTNSAAAPKQTYVTDESYPVTNQEFLETLFGAQVADTRPVVVSFNGNPATVKKKAWYGGAWDKDKSNLHPDANNYFSIAAFRPDDAGQYRRIKSNFSALHAIVLDDVGVKVSMERLTLTPSWVLETSPANYQFGYILTAPLQDTALADQIMKAIIAAALCDPGAGGPTARLVRLPEGVNGKYNPVFVCQMRAWNPDVFYRPQQLIDGLQLEVHSKEHPKSASVKPYSNDGNQILTPAPMNNAVIEALRARKLYKSPLGNGKHDMTCPWVAEHTDKIDGGTAYFEPGDNWPLGGFRCQ